MLSSDEAFEQQLPQDLQIRASIHFTPIDVARRAARLLATDTGMSILDIGAGAGKFCLAAAEQVPTATFVGVEWRGRLVRLAKQFAERLELSNVQFIHADALELDWSKYDAFYLFNPFAEQLTGDALVLDETFALEPEQFVVYVAAVRHRLSLARVGTRVATYHGYGAPAPLGYDLVRRERAGTDAIELWVKTRLIQAGEATEGFA